MDFVDSTTGRPVNSPIQYELWMIPSVDAQLCGRLPVQIFSVERHHHIPQEKIRPGEERFILRDGRTYFLRRSGYDDVRFTVPIRRKKCDNIFPTSNHVDILPLPASHSV